MNITDSARKTVKGFPGGYAGMGAAIGMSPNVLRNKVSRTNDTHHLTVADAVDIMEQAESANVPDPHAILRQLAADFGYQLVPEGRGTAGDLSLAEQLLEASEAAAGLGLEVIHAIKDGVITPTEMDRISERRLDASRAAAELEQAARTFTAQPLKAVG